MKQKLALLCLLIILTSCGGSYSSMMQDFNGNFTQTYYGKETMKFGDLEFKEELMIPKEKYFIFYECSVSFSAPLGATNYKWTLEKYHAKQKSVINVQNTRSFLYSFGNYPTLGVPYILTIEAEDKNGIKFTDSTEIILYEDISDITM